MPVVELQSITPEMSDLVGGKAAGLAALLGAGERVPPGFCVPAGAPPTTAEVRAAYERLGGGPVAVRSSAVGEDAADASFAGVYDSVLDVRGLDELLAAVERCRASTTGARAAAYVAGPAGRGAEPAGVRMAVVVQRMVDARVAGVLFTANPVTGRRTEMLVDAAPGPGSTVVDGRTATDHYVLDGTAPTAAGCLPPAARDELRRVGERLQQHFGAPQDVEWAMDPAGDLWLLQSRPITTLFPAPPVTDRPQPRVHLEFGHVQGMLQPVTPMGMSTLEALVKAMLVPLGLQVEITGIGGRLYGDLTDLARDPRARKRLIALMAVDFGPRAQAVMRHVLDDPGFAPRPGRAARPGAGSAVRAVSGVLRALARPEAARGRLLVAVERLRAASADEGAGLTAEERLRIVRAGDEAESPDDLVWPIVAGMLAAALPSRLLAGIARPDEVHAVLGGMPHNVTIEMDLALWRIARHAGEHRRLLLDTPPAELAARYLAGELPPLGLENFLETYGHRGVAEVDLGVPRWAEDPAPVFAALANYLRVTDPAQAPDQRFARAAGTAEAMLRELAVRARRRPVRGRLAIFLLGRARQLAGLREAGKFAGLHRLRQMRRHLLLIGADLTGAGLLDEPGDIMFLTRDEAHTAVHGKVDHRAAIAGRKARHAREMRRRSVPVALLSDGTDVEAVLPAPPDPGALRGIGASAGRATGPARVVHDPATARIEPGEVLVAAITDPGWTPLFLTAAALVTETGAVMAHGPTVAREYGIPAVICVPGATDRIATGQIVTVDSAAGTVTLAKG